MEALTTADGRTLAYRRVGDGPLLLCHPGGPGFDSGYLRDLAGLGRSRTLILLDPRGTGGSDRPASERAYATDDYVADVEEVRVHLGVEALDLFGHSHGGVVGMAYAARHPSRVRRLVLASTLPRFVEPQQQAMEEMMKSRLEEDWYEDARAALEAEQAGEFADDDELKALVAREMPFYTARLGDVERAYLHQIAKERPNRDALKLFNDEVFEVFDLRPDLVRIEAETLVITGEQDFITGPVSAREIAEALPGARLEILPDCGHFIFVEQPHAFRDAVERFLAG
jgi:proline-specific peptidase